MEIQATHRQSFGGIIASKKYVGQQLAKIKDAKGKAIVRNLMDIVEQSDMVDLVVSKNDDVSLKYKYPFSRILGKGRKIAKTNKENTFIKGLIEACTEEAKDGIINGIFRGFFSVPKGTPSKKIPVIISESTKKQAKAVLDALEYGFGKTTKTK